MTEDEFQVNFNDLVREGRLGIRLKLEEVSPDEHELFGSCRDSTRALLQKILLDNSDQVGKIALYFDLVNDDVVNGAVPNAGAFIKDEEGAQYFFIGITTSAVRELNREFERCVEISAFRKRLLLPDPTSADDCPDLASPAVLDRETHAQYARALMLYAIDFIAYHELGHLLKGHSQLTSATTPVASLEFGTASGALSKLEGQTLELDADRFAGMLALQSLNIDVAIGRDSGAPVADVDLFRRSLFFWFVAISSFFTLDRLGSEDLDQLDSREHPLPIVRLDSIVSNIVPMPEVRRRGIPADEVRSIAVEALALVEMISRPNVAGPFAPGRVEVLCDERVSSYIERLHKTWASVCPKLRPFRRVPEDC